ncbi:beta-ketoacyl synthase chain length factor [Rhodoferax sp.]|uniref:beta-ketoacyl synthase chain length factor n=1 Tax=Rhodoferax sp. TaxID=50421 RepID=UPI00277A399F|nr:beta-ketoacyl synthase chain length factor [Rhodoferax sp.]
MSALRVHVDGIGLFGPGMAGWTLAREVLTGQAPFELATVQLPPVNALPPAERRRVGVAIKLAMATGFEAARHAGADAAQLNTVFSSTGGDCDNCHNILETLASSDRAVSPTRFHNSVHNAPAGYWSIATGCMAASTSLCAFDATFAAGLLEATVQAVSTGQPCLLIAFDTAYPEPLYALRQIPYAMGVGLLLNPHKTAASCASLSIEPSSAVATPMDDPALEDLRQRIPAARSLPLLQRLARGGTGSVVIDYLGAPNLAIEVTP